MESALYAGLPAQCPSPRHAAQAIARADSCAERERLFAAFPGVWQPLIAHFAVFAIAARIVDEPVKARRQDMLAATPEAWRPQVKAHVLNAWRARHLIAASEQRLLAVTEA